MEYNISENVIKFVNLTWIKTNTIETILLYSLDFLRCVYIFQLSFTTIPTVQLFT